jgi:hypothetical protein
MKPLNAIVSGPVASGPFESDDPAPHAVSQDWFDVVCPNDERRYIDINTNVRGAKPAVAQQASGIDILTHCSAMHRSGGSRLSQREMHFRRYSTPSFG